METSPSLPGVILILVSSHTRLGDPARLSENDLHDAEKPSHHFDLSGPCSKRPGVKAQISAPASKAAGDSTAPCPRSGQKKPVFPSRPVFGSGLIPVGPLHDPEPPRRAMCPPGVPRPVRERGSQ